MNITDFDFVNVRAFAAIVLALGALALVIFAATHSGKGVVAALLLVAGVGTLGYFEYQYQDAQRKATLAIEQVYQNPTLTLHCERLTESLTATAKSGERYEEDHPTSAWVAQAPCSDFLGWVKGDKAAATAAQEAGIYAVAKEAAVRSGNQDACAGIVDMGPLAGALGATPAAASALTRDYYTTVWTTTPGNPGCSLPS